MKEVVVRKEMFEDIKHVDEYGREFWYARELQKLLNYIEWRKFEGVISKAKEACKNSNYKVHDHFVGADKMIEIAKGGKRKGLRYREDILDNMGSEELVDNLFRIVQTEAKLKKDKVNGENNADNVHFIMGRDIRKFIENQGGTMPEDLPTPEKSLKKIEKENKKNLLKK